MTQDFYSPMIRVRRAYCCGLAMGEEGETMSLSLSQTPVEAEASLNYYTERTILPPDL
jgi:hypothetical protein